jgi:hypothetical protein
MEIRSYRRVFDLERRIYRIDQIRLNPGGVPVRGIVYSLLAISAALVGDRFPLIGALAAPVPWFLRDLVMPAAVASLLTVTRVDGRPLDKSMHALLRSRVGPRRVSVRTPSSVGAPSRWRPPALVMLPDGSESSLRHCRYAGPGAVYVVARHRCERSRPHLRAWLRRRACVVLFTPERPAEGVRGRVIVLDRGARLSVH